MSTDQIVFSSRRDRISEGSGITVTARFLDAGAATTPTNVRYRLDNLDSGITGADWTPVSTGTTASIAIPGSTNECRTQLPIEQWQLTVSADYGLATEFREAFLYEVRNLGLGAS